jgi:Metallo-beta-lactamase superfamily
MHTYRPHADVTVMHDQAEIPGLGYLPVNAFVLHAEQPVVLDTGLSLPDRNFVQTLSEIMDPADVRWVWLTHPDRDHTGGIYDMLEAAPNAKIVTTFIGVGILSTERPLPLDRVHLLNPGQTLDVGDRQLTGFRPPLFDNPATVGVYDSKTGVCFSSDCFGAPLPSSDLAASENISAVSTDEVIAGQLLWASVDSPWVHKVDQAKYEAGFEPFRRFDPSWTFSVHLPPIEGSLDPMLQTLRGAPGSPEFVGPDQVALEAMLASFEPVGA